MGHRFFWTLPVFPHFFMMTVCLDGIPVKGFSGDQDGFTTITENEALRFPHWKFKPGPAISGTGGQQSTKATQRPVTWRDTRSFSPIIANVPRTLWGRTILGVTTDDW